MADLDPFDQIADAPFDEALSKRYLVYALSTITARSLPDVRDGLKPVHRRLLWGMRLLRLDPAIARAFGKNGIEAVTRAEGMLIDSEITGEDAGSDIKTATRNEGQLDEELRRIEQQLARSRAGSAEAAELQAQAERIRESIRANRATRAERQESLAKTPMVFNYGSGDVIPGFDTRSSLRTALDRARGNFIGGIAAMLVIAVTLLPWILLGLLLFWAFRRGRKAWLRSQSRGADAEAPIAAP